MNTNRGSLTRFDSITSARRAIALKGGALATLFLLMVACQGKGPEPLEACKNGTGYIDGQLVMFDGGHYATTWLDRDGDGTRSPTEPPLESVCIWSVPELSMFDAEHMLNLCGSPDSVEWLLTDSRGVRSGGFWAGACCEDIYVFAFTPEGYRATTPLAVAYCEAEFGFQPVDQSLATEQPTTSEAVAQLVDQQRRVRALHTLGSLALVLGVPVAVLLAVSWASKVRVRSQTTKLAERHQHPPRRAQ